MSKSKKKKPKVLHPKQRLFGQRVQQLRRLKGLTQERLAEEIGRSVDAISNIERGFSFTRLDTAIEIADALGVTLPELFEFSTTAKGSARTHRREVERLMGLILKCPANRLPTLTKIIEQAVQLTSD